MMGLTGMVTGLVYPMLAQLNEISNSKRDILFPIRPQRLHINVCTLYIRWFCRVFA